MRSMLDMDTIQIEITNACKHKCANCTRFCGHQDPYFMTLEQFKKSIDSLVGYPKMVGIMGGEPLLHPDFEVFCEYALSKIPKKQLGLWTSFPFGYEYYRKLICETFYHIFLNDHTMNNIYHHPPLVAINEVILNKNMMYHYIDHCWAQENWSASINPKGAFFCEIAASMSILFNGSDGWDIEPEWWFKTTKDFKEQIEEFCPSCGFAVPLKRRTSIEIIDDISPGNLEKLKGKSYKIDNGEFIISDLQMTNDLAPLAAYKDVHYRDRIADRYDIFLAINEQGFMTPYLKNDNYLLPKKPLIDIYRENMNKGE